MGAHKVNPFARGNDAPPPSLRVHDQMGRPLHPGDMVAMMRMGTPVFSVVDLGPVLDPGAPPGLVKVTLQATMVIGAKAGAKLDNIMRVATAAELGIQVKPEDEGDKPTELKLVDS